MHLAIHIAIWGIALIFTGFAAAIKYCPDILAGYSTMSKEKKKKIDINGFAKFVCRGMLITVWSMVAVVYAAYFITGNPDVTKYLVVWLMAGMIIIAVKAQRFDHT